MGERDGVEARKLLDKLAPNEAAEGRLVGVLGTTYENDPHFVETDWLPNILGLGLWDDKNWTSRIALEKALSRTDGVSLLLDARCMKEVSRTRASDVTDRCCTPRSRCSSTSARFAWSLRVPISRQRATARTVRWRRSSPSPRSDPIWAR
jgi:hypothetical protein